MTEETTDTTPLLQKPQHRRTDTSTSYSTIIRKSWNTMADMISPFSADALSSLPKHPVPGVDRSTRADNIPEPGPSSDAHRNYRSIANRLPPGITVPKKIATPIKVEGKVWFANERTWVAYTNLGVLLGTLAIALFNASEDPLSRYFGYFYALVSCGVVVYGYVVYQQRVTLIRKRYPGHMDQLWGPVVISVLLFFAVATNFLLRFRD